MQRKRQFGMLGVLMAMSVPALAGQAPDSSAKAELLRQIEAVSGDLKADPRQFQGWVKRARLLAAIGDHEKAAADYSEAIKLDSMSAEVWQRRGEENFKGGKFPQSVSDFDKYLSLVPDQKPYHWQRGISLYYAGRYADGKKQFALHQTVNSNDVENAVWHFLCTARAEGLEAARKQLIPIEGDARVPMAEVHRLFAGKASAKDVLAAARAAPSQTRAGEPMFYANLYLGLYYEAIGSKKQARIYILKAAERSNENGYMGDVALVHAGLLRVSLPKPRLARTKSVRQSSTVVVKTASYTKSEKSIVWPLDKLIRGVGAPVEGVDLELDPFAYGDRFRDVQALAWTIRIGTTRAAVEQIFPQKDGGLSGSSATRYYVGSGIMVEVPFDQSGGAWTAQNRVNGIVTVYRSHMHIH